MQLTIVVQLILAAGLVLIMFGIGLSLARADFTAVITRRRALLIGLAAQLLGLPIAALLTIWIWGLPPEIALGLLIIASSPGGATSNLFSYLMKADVALSVSLTVLSSTLCIFTVPLLLSAASEILTTQSRVVRVPPQDIFLPLIVLVLFPLLAGMTVRWLRPHWANKIHRPTSRLSVLILVASLAYVFYVEHQRFLAHVAELGAIVVFFFLLAASLGALSAKLARLEGRQIKTIVIEVGIQNGMQAIVIATSPLIFGSPVLAIPAAIYSVMMYPFMMLLYVVIPVVSKP